LYPCTGPATKKAPGGIGRFIIWWPVKDLPMSLP